MDIKKDIEDKRIKTLKNQKEKRKEEVIHAAIEVFKEKGIDNAKMTDIADKAQVGVASVYRYFSTKLDLAILAATELWNEEISSLYERFYTKDYENLNGRDKVNVVLNIFVNIYIDYPEFLSFLEHFDNYLVKENISAEKLEAYEKNIIDIKSFMFEALDLGKKDGSIKKDIDNNVFYNSIAHSLISLSQKLILRGTILNSDREVAGDLQIKLLIDMAMNYL